MVVITHLDVILKDYRYDEDAIVQSLLKQYPVPPNRIVLVTNYDISMKSTTRNSEMDDHIIEAICTMVDEIETCRKNTEPIGAEAFEAVKGIIRYVRGDGKSKSEGKQNRSKL